MRLVVRNRLHSLLVAVAVQVPGFFGFTGIRTRNALVTFEWIEETALI